MRQEIPYFISVLVGILALQVVGCADEDVAVENQKSEYLETQKNALVERTDLQLPESTNPPTPPTRYEYAIGPQFAPYTLDEYEIVEQATLPGLSGRFVAVRHRLKDGESVDRKALEERIASALLGDGWERASLPSYEPMPKNFRFGDGDLYFTHGSSGSDDELETYHQRISIDEDATEVVCYWEAFWS